MDSLTQIVLGASVGEAVLGKKVGNKAILWGAIAGTIPDLDVFVGRFFSEVDNLLIHRGFSHSIAFSILCAPVLAWIIHKIHKKSAATYKDWVKLAFLGLLTHPLLDCFTTWGTQLFWPFDYRVALNNIFVVDPLYTLPFLIFVVWSMFKRRDTRMRRRLNYIGLTISSLYLVFSLIAKFTAIGVFDKALSQQQISPKHYDTKPMPFSTILWTANAVTEKEVYVGYYSLLDSHENIRFERFERNLHLLDKYHIREHEDIQKLIFISKGFYALTKTKEGVQFHDLRFGIAGFNNTTLQAVFAYQIDILGSGEQRIINIYPKRFTGDLDFTPMWERMKGI